MKALFYAFSGFLIFTCLVLLVVNFNTGSFDSSTHLHLDVVVRTASDTFANVYNNDFLSTMRELTSTSITDSNPFVQAFGVIMSIGTFLWNGVSALVGGLSAFISVITTPFIY